MAEIEYKGIKVGGSKLLLILPLIGTLIGGLWGGFEVYQRYIIMEKKINSFVSPDLSGYDKRIELIGLFLHNFSIDSATKYCSLLPEPVSPTAIN